MEKLSRVKSIKDYGFFQDFEWTQGVKPFSRYNLIFGWNGCGKSTFAKLFKDIEENNIDTLKFDIKMQEDGQGQQEKSYNKKNSSEISNRFKVFNEDYVQGIKKLDDIDHITIIGHKEVKKAEKIDVLKKDREAIEVSLKKERDGLKDLNDEFDEYKRQVASDIRNQTGLSQGYNYRRVYEDYQALENDTGLSKEEYDKLIVSVRSKVKPKIKPLECKILSHEIISQVADILKELPIHKTIDSLKGNTELRAWTEKGFNLHKNQKEKKCLFCGGSISEARWEDLEQFFNDSMTNFNKNINGLSEEFKIYSKRYDTLYRSLPNQYELYEEYMNDYIVKKCELESEHTRNIEFIDNIIELLNKKRDNFTVVEEYLAELERLKSDIDINKYKKLLDDINDLIAIHNEKSENFSKEIEKDKQTIKNYILTKAKDKFKNYEEKIKQNNSRVEKYGKEKEKLNSDIEAIEKEIMNSRIPAETINKEIVFITGRSELKFAWKETGYEIKRGECFAEELSTGEVNAIALIYFFNSLKDMSVNEENTIVILDDPISSFDSNFYYSSIAYIREKLSSVAQAIILTHKFNLYKDFKRMFGQDNNSYMLVREGNRPVLKEINTFLDNFEDEYVYLFEKIYKLARYNLNDFGDIIPYPNMARRLLEGFVSFKMPDGKTDLLDKVIAMDRSIGKDPKRERSFLRLVNNRSHMREIFKNEFDETIINADQLNKILNDILDFIEEHDCLHYSTLVEKVNVNKKIPEKKEKRIIKLFDLKASAGPGNVLSEDESYEDYETENEDADFAVKIKGDSMESYLKDGDIVLVKKKTIIENNKIGIIGLNGEVFCKKYVETRRDKRLVSINRNYDSIILNESDNIFFFGEVIGKNE